MGDIGNVRERSPPARAGPLLRSRPPALEAGRPSNALLIAAREREREQERLEQLPPPITFTLRPALQMSDHPPALAREQQSMLIVRYFAMLMAREHKLRSQQPVRRLRSNLDVEPRPPPLSWNAIVTVAHLVTMPEFLLLTCGTTRTGVWYAICRQQQGLFSPVFRRDVLGPSDISLDDYCLGVNGEVFVRGVLTYPGRGKFHFASRVLIGPTAAAAEGMPGTLIKETAWPVTPHIFTTSLRLITAFYDRKLFSVDGEYLGGLDGMPVQLYNYKTGVFEDVLNERDRLRLLEYLGTERVIFTGDVVNSTLVTTHNVERADYASDELVMQRPEITGFDLLTHRFERVGWFPYKHFAGFVPRGPNGWAFVAHASVRGDTGPYSLGIPRYWLEPLLRVRDVVFDANKRPVSGVADGVIISPPDTYGGGQWNISTHVSTVYELCIVATKSTSPMYVAVINWSLIEERWGRASEKNATTAKFTLQNGEFPTEKRMWFPIDVYIDLSPSSVIEPRWMQVGIPRSSIKQAVPMLLF